MWKDGDAMKDRLLAIAKEKGVVPTEFFEKIVKAKERFGIELECPCDRDNPKRFCISELCLSDIEKDCTCHCHCWRKK